MLNISTRQQKRNKGPRMIMQALIIRDEKLMYLNSEEATAKD
jgi:hypothetical protein